MTQQRSRGLGAAVLVGLVLSLAACGSSSKSSSTTAAASSESTSAGSTTVPGSGDSEAPGTASAAVCAARDDLQTSITDLKDVNIASSGTSGLQAAITKIKDNLSTLKSAAGDQLKPEIDAFQTSLDDLQTAIKNVSSGGVAAVVTAVKDAGTSGADLLDALSELKCG
jgi:hypothetical protein